MDESTNPQPDPHEEPDVQRVEVHRAGQRSNEAGEPGQQARGARPRGVRVTLNNRQVRLHLPLWQMIFAMAILIGILTLATIFFIWLLPFIIVVAVAAFLVRLLSATFGSRR